MSNKNNVPSADSFIYEQNILDNSELIKTLKKKINTWANSIEHHPYKNLGDKIKVDELWYKPAYPVTFRTQYEARSKGKGHEPYTNQKIPPLEIIELSDFNEWDRNLGEIKGFTDDVSNYTVSGSQSVDNCFKCGAKGHITCFKCRGERDITCPTCRGSKRINCSSCNGSGKNRCTSCSGQGYKNVTIHKTRQVYVPAQRYEEGSMYSNRDAYYKTENYTETGRETCSSCSGRGSKRCSPCSGSGKVTCSRCSGRGRVQCPICAGTGINTCPECKGHKKLMHYYYICRELNYTQQYENIINGTVFDNFPEFRDKCDDFESYNVHSRNMDLFDENYLDEDNHLSPFTKEMIAISKTSKKNNQQIQFQQLDIGRIDAWELYYSFNDKNYVMLFFGDDYEIIQGKSPIYEIALEYWDNAVKSYRRRNYSRAWNLIAKADKIDTYEDKENIEDSLVIIEEKLDSSYTFGGMLAGWLSAFLFSIMAYIYFSKVNWVFGYADFINNPDNFLFDYHVFTGTAGVFVLSLIGGFVGGSFSARFRALIPIAAVRFITGLLFGIITAAILAVFWGALNAVGITIIITFLIWAAVWILNLILFLVGLALGLLVLAWEIIVWIYGIFF